MATILLADDDADLREMFALWLEGLDDVSIRSAGDGAEAVELLDESVDLAVLDRRMPRTSGDEVARTIRSTYPDCDVIIVSAFEPDENLADDEYDRYLTKPLQREPLVSAVESRVADLATPTR